MKTTLQNGVNLAYWLYKVHPEIYARVLPLANRARGRKLGSLGDDFLPGISTFDPSTVDTLDATNLLDTTTDPAAFSDPGSFSFDASFNPIDTLTPDIASIATPDLVNVSVDTSGFTTPNFQTDWGNVFDSIGSDLASVGSWLTSSQGLTTVGNLTNTILKANTPQQQTVQTQISRVAAGSNPAPITYGVDSSGQVVPILQTGYNTGQALNQNTLASLLPSSLSQYATPISIGLLALIGISLARSGRRG